MPILLFLRHGDAGRAADDASRTLSPLGETQAQTAARALRQLFPSVDILFCSPLVRARQTADAVAAVVAIGQRVTTEYLTSSSDPRQIVEEINRHAAGTMLFVGHEPHLSTTISLLVEGSRNPAVRMNTGSLACLDAPARVKYGACKIRWLLPFDATRA